MKSILHKAVQKQIELMRLEVWKEELINHAPPILWFGDIQSRKERILTIAANPSRWEVLYRNGRPRERVRILKPNEYHHDILLRDNLADEILKSYNRYFTHDPYTKWFGKRNEPHNVEGFLRGMKASYYEMSGYENIALHADLFPFPTRRDYSEIYPIVKEDLFTASWAKDVLFGIIDRVNPVCIVVFGRGNTNALHNDLIGSSSRTLTEMFQSSLGNSAYYSYCNIQTRIRNYQCCCISTNLGNPIPFTKNELTEFGRHVRLGSGLSL